MVQKVPRRRVLQGVGAALGAGSLGALTAGPARAAQAPARTVRFDLQVEGLRTSAPGPQRTVGQQSVLSGVTVQTPTAPVPGAFSAVATAVHATGRAADHDFVGSLETQAFHLPDGVLIGQGTTAHDGSGAFAVTGGTGAYHGARGSYTQRRDLHRFGGGTASYSFTLILAEATEHGV